MTLRRRPPTRPPTGTHRSTSQSRKSSPHRNNASLQRVGLRRDQPPSPPQYNWVRPMMQHYQGRVNHYVRTELLSEIATCLQHHSCREKFAVDGFGTLLGIRRGESAYNALHHLMARQVTDHGLDLLDIWI